MFFQGKMRYFVFLVLAFGLATAGYVFTKLLRPLIKKWRSEGKKSIIYLDDGLLAACNFERTNTIASEAERDLFKAGLTVNTEKSHLTPQQRGIWLGFLVDTLKMEFIAPGEKIKALKETLGHLLRKNFVNAKELARVAGKIISLSPAIGNLTSLFTRQIYKFIEMRKFWYQDRKMPQ